MAAQGDGRQGLRQGREVRAQFSQPVRQIVLMLIVIGAFSAGAYVAFPQVAPVFAQSPWLNGTIGVVFVVGVLACFLQVLQLVSAVNWIEDFARDRPGFDIKRPPRLLAPLAALLRSRGARMQIGASSSRSILDSVATRLDEARDITRYITSLLIFLGLLGTFYGLATTIPAVVDTIRSLAPAPGESSTAIFGRLIGGLETQLGGMGTAFASSLLGLAGSLVVGLLELFAGHGQNRFYRELEEWLSSITRVGFSAGDTDMSAESSMFATLMDQMTEQFDALNTTFIESDQSRAAVDEKLGMLAASVERLSQKVSEDANINATLARIAEGQENLIAAINAVTARPITEADALEAETRSRLRSIDVQLLRILEELTAGRQESTTELRRDLARLTRVIEIAADPSGGQGQGR
ncbi:biopolymer transporter ExbB [Meridianimarinicoccus roseus]|uniref:Biopolymer transporter ExbB n=1 Tax=Meridianimarinicoccus roseus TaxID=2072018 RepID=A0A2V2LC52_9RHOB|nr:biopolymer transporter ExbB [Meridianimarinicoccus roseus]PWR00847.1 biopolymer transporter ExbB [Meridianimarinicoccus roseus]